ncbi:QacE family quaternary ammonium compound efflux SMR transporter [Paracoccus yeei]|jgi:small multidrug resistance pump|uniref:QacE family quaternary ammonium compound efflux SMR transporter n=2 Tax=Paracoccus TaxID=265 RepID=A0A1V0GW50_9RHOB|nr:MULTISPECIES: SMR family transporter [Paracoccus]ARC38020.1 QacE family quaternary ammonium compound efflux SMR transporter [Paracoccus yeei]ATQ57119.1 QacE family quaternary ammonium compound efflux SMR transporter [Paracoccus yeei]AWX94080.1 QacE family quaternary ammonium compound efflux SMR transporter [Paracoccus mutanolyticus]AYF01219.1 small multidrug resistance family protein [Paracoccus yeei]MBY0136829.1 QacE family quaternary ammonium compound efflux SMR transporter [Paracoccus ye
MPVLTYTMLTVAIALEVVGTTFLQRSEQFTRLFPTLMTAICYGAAFYFLSLTLRTIPLGIAYAIWSALGIVLVSLIGLVVFGQKLDLPAVIGLGLIVAGVVVVNLFSNSVTH